MDQWAQDFVDGRAEWIAVLPHETRSPAWSGHGMGMTKWIPRGRGWADIKGDELHGLIAIHHGDESAFVAKRKSRSK